MAAESVRVHMYANDHKIQCVNSVTNTISHTK
jgi:hypothetical protein